MFFYSYRGQQYGPLYAIFFMYRPSVIILKPDDIKVKFNHVTTFLIGLIKFISVHCTIDH